MTTERLIDIIAVLKAVTNNKNRETVMNAVMDLVKDSYESGKKRNEVDHFTILLSLEEAKRETK